MRKWEQQFESTQTYCVCGGDGCGYYRGLPYPHIPHRNEVHEADARGH